MQTLGCSGVMVGGATMSTGMFTVLVAEQPMLSVAVTVSVTGWPLVSALNMTEVPFCWLIVPLVIDQVTVDQVFHELFGSGGSMNASSCEPVQVGLLPTWMAGGVMVRTVTVAVALLVQP